MERFSNERLKRRVFKVQEEMYSKGDTIVNLRRDLMRRMVSVNEVEKGSDRLGWKRVVYEVQ